MKVNSQIRAPKLRLIDETGGQLGIMNFNEALDAAQNRGIDLVEISPTASPPVAKLMDYSKFLFEEKKREKDQKRSQRQGQADLREIQIKPVCQENDLAIKIKNVQRLLDEGNKVKILIKFSGRQIRHVELGKPMFEKIIAAIPEAIIESKPEWAGRNLAMILAKSSK